MLDVNDGEEEAVEEDAGNEGDDGRNGDDEDGGVEVAGESEVEDGEKGGAKEGGGWHGDVEGDHEYVSCVDSKNGTQAGGKDVSFGDVEHDGESQSGQGGCKGLGGVKVFRGYGYMGERWDVCDAYGTGNAKGHGGHDKDGMGDAGHAGGEVVVQEVIDAVDEWDAGNEGEGAGDDRKEGGSGKGKVHGEVSGEGSSESGGGDSDVSVDFQLCTYVFHDSACHGGKKGVKSIYGVAAEDEAESSGSHADGKDDHPFRIDTAAAGLLDPVQMGFECAVWLILREGFPGHIAGLEDGGHVDTVAVAFAEHGISMIFIVHVDHNGGVGDVDLYVFPVDAQISSGSEHVFDDSFASGAAFHKELACIQNEFHFISDREGRIVCFHNFPF